MCIPLVQITNPTKAWYWFPTPLGMDNSQMPMGCAEEEGVWISKLIGAIQSESSLCQLQVRFQTELNDLKSWYPLIKTLTKFRKQICHGLYIFIKKTNKKTVNLVKCTTRAGTHEPHRHDLYTIQLNSSLKSITCTLSHQCSNRACNNQSRLMTFVICFVVKQRWSSDCISGHIMLWWLAGVFIMSFTPFPISCLNHWDKARLFGIIYRWCLLVICYLVYRCH